MACLGRHYTTALDDLPVHILSEFDDPGLRLTCSQIRRLLDRPEFECREALDYLTRSGLLRRNPRGQYCLARVTEGTRWISS